MMLAFAAMVVSIICIFDALRCRNAFEDERAAHGETLGMLGDAQRERDQAIENLRASQRLLRQAMKEIPATPSGRELGDAITVTAWEERKVRRLLHAVDDPTPTGGAA